MTAEVLPPMSLHTQSYPLSPEARDFLAGAVAGALSIATTQPLDVVRIRMQSSHMAVASVLGGGPALKAKAVPEMLTCMVRKEGVLSPFKGMSFPLAFTALQSALIFRVYGSSLRYFTSRQQQTESSSSDSGVAAVSSTSGLGSSSTSSTSSSSSCGSGTSQAAVPTLYSAFLAGSCAGIAQVFLWSPIEMLKIRMQLQTCRPGTPNYVGPGRMLSHILTTEGVAGLYRGISVTTLRDAPSYGVYFCAYRALAGVCEPGVAPEDASALTQILAGGSAGCIAWLSIYPLDVIKSRMQGAAGSSATRGKTWLHYARDVWSEGGMRGMWRGIGPTLARAFVMDAVSFLGYTNVLRLLREP